MSRVTRRSLAGTVLAGVAALSFAAPASAVVYEGKIKGEPGSSLSFTIEKVDGQRHVTEAEWEGVPTECDGTPQDTMGSSGFGTGTRVKHRKFDARLNAGLNKNRLKGELQKPGKASGIFHNVFGMMVICDTGILEWKAEKA